MLFTIAASPANHYGGRTFGWNALALSVIAVADHLSVPVAAKRRIISKTRNLLLIVLPVPSS